MHKRNLFQRVEHYFDKLEDSIRGYLSKRPILYTFIGGTAVVLFWRGIWHTADLFPFLTGPMSIIISVVILLATGLFVSYFVGDMIIISGLKKDKKMSDKKEEEFRKEEMVMERIEEKLDELNEKIEAMEDKIQDHNEEHAVDKNTPHLL
jgi:low affinity Fe/Cu permease